MTRSSLGQRPPRRKNSNRRRCDALFAKPKQSLPRGRSHSRRLLERVSSVNPRSGLGGLLYGASQLGLFEVENCTSETHRPAFQMTHFLDGGSDLIFAQQLKQKLPVTPEAFLQHSPDQPCPVVLDIHSIRIGVPEQVWRESFHYRRRMGRI